MAETNANAAPHNGIEYVDLGHAVLIFAFAGESTALYQDGTRKEGGKRGAVESRTPETLAWALP